MVVGRLSCRRGASAELRRAPLSAAARRAAGRGLEAAWLQGGCSFAEVDVPMRNPRAGYLAGEVPSVGSAQVP